MHAITKVAALPDYKVELTFDDNSNGIVDLSSHVGHGVFEVWNDVEIFRAVRIGSSGELTWGEDIDLCADALYLEVTGKNPEDIFPSLKQEDVHA